MKDTRRMLWTLLLLLCGGAAAWAQFNPSNPPDPYMLYKVVAKATGGNYTSGSGSYTMGTQVRLNTSAASSNYEFLHWTKNGVVYTTDRQFTYTVEAENVEFVAVYKFNPDNPSGNYIPKADLLRLVEWSREKGIRLVIDESFVDFAEEENSTLISQEILSENPHFYIPKSV